MVLFTNSPHRCRCLVFLNPFTSSEYILKGIAEIDLASITTMAALLALHIESALDPDETVLIRSMARNSISQTMLLLRQGEEIPALKRALPVFEDILVKKNLSSAPHNAPPAQVQSQDTSMENTQPQAGTLPSQSDQGENTPLLYGDFLGLDFLNDGNLASWSSLFNADMGMDCQEQTE